VLSSVAWLLVLLILLSPPCFVVALVLGARSLSRRRAPPVAVFVTLFLASVAGLLALAGYVAGVLVAVGPVRGEEVEPSQKARALAEGISEAMNCGAVALLIALIAAGWIGFWMWRRGRPDRS
jgi:hypothetical protein